MFDAVFHHDLGFACSHSHLEQSLEVDETNQTFVLYLIGTFKSTEMAHFAADLSFWKLETCRYCGLIGMG